MTRRYPTRASTNAKHVTFLGYFFVHSHFPPIHTPPSLPSLLPYPLPFHPSLLFLKEVNKKLSYRRQNALTIKAIPSANILFYAHTVFCRPVRSFVSLFVTLYFLKKKNEPSLMKIGRSLPRGKDMNGRPRGSAGQSQGHKRPKLELEAWQKHPSRLLESSR